ncbi:peptidyl-dipeptidase A, partial [mine drainage metagenome]
MPTIPPDGSAVLASAEAELLDLAVESGRAEWVQATYVNDDTADLAARATARLLEATARWARTVAALPRAGLSPSDARKIHLLRTGLPLIAPVDPALARELVATVNGMQATYAKGRYTPRGTSEPLDLQALSRILADVREPVRLEEAWTGWHRIGREIRRPFARYVDLANRGARELDFPDLGAL